MQRAEAGRASRPARSSRRSTKSSLRSDSHLEPVASSGRRGTARPPSSRRCPRGPCCGDALVERRRPASRCDRRSAACRPTAAARAAAPCARAAAAAAQVVARRSRAGRTRRAWPGSSTAAALRRSVRCSCARCCSRWKLGMPASSCTTTSPSMHEARRTAVPPTARAISGKTRRQVVAVARQQRDAARRGRPAGGSRRTSARTASRRE